MSAQETMSSQDPSPDGPQPSAVDTPSPPPEEAVAPEVAASLTDALRAMYDTVVDEPLPDAFAQLLSRLDDSDA
jgi:hypothetical protein